MADFFGELGKKIADTASDLSKKAEDTLEVQKIKGEIRSLKRANERDYKDIGRMVYVEGKEVPQKCDVPYQIVRGGIIRTD